MKEEEAKWMHEAPLRVLADIKFGLDEGYEAILSKNILEWEKQYFPLLTDEAKRILGAVEEAKKYCAGCVVEYQGMKGCKHCPLVMFRRAWRRGG